ncbi:hypothetical protein BB560_007251 [Smittium megazygosporum]|uniref:Uncharacterized protein n=1 Tax=Smittium megazygosporum TaxID=133381 RepID=A0A2T9XXN4_9FUNG|nr:hypothetical protein BB560_007251 [Smittium megazygosporum]
MCGSRVGRVYLSASFVGSPRRQQRIPEDQNLSEMMQRFIIHSNEIACNRDPSVCIKHFPTPVSNRTYIYSCRFPVYRRHTQQDQTRFLVPEGPVDEIREFIKARSPSVTALQIHLENQKQVIFNKVDEIQQALGSAVLPLELYFSRLPELNNYAYAGFYENFIVLNSNKVPWSVSNY